MQCCLSSLEPTHNEGFTTSSAQVRNPVQSKIFVVVVSPANMALCCGLKDYLAIRDASGSINLQTCQPAPRGTDTTLTPEAQVTHHVTTTMLS